MTADETQALIQQYQSGYMKKIFYFCLKKTGNAAEAEELASDIALNVLTALCRGAAPQQFSAWVWAIARHRYARWAQEKHKKSPPSRPATSAITRSPTSGKAWKKAASDRSSSAFSGASWPSFPANTGKSSPPTIWTAAR